MDFEPVQNPPVGFRVKVHDPGHPSNNDTSRGGDGMLPRDPSRPLDATAFRDHLTRVRRGGPLISSTTSWVRAMRRRDHYIHGEGARNVVAIAVWLKGLAMYDAFDVANSEHIDLNYHQVGQHLDEVLLHACISAKERRILATFHGSQQAQMVELSLPRFTSDYLVLSNLSCLPAARDAELHLPEFTSSLQVPRNPSRPHETMSERLKSEMYSHTGVLDAAKYIHLALSMSGQRYTVEQNGKFTLLFPLRVLTRRVKVGG